ncbi:hypothetical protein ACFL22_00910 [Patescibacteria group bacterium]
MSQKKLFTVTSLLLAIASSIVSSLSSMITGSIPLDQNRYRVLCGLIGVIGLEPFRKGKMELFTTLKKTVALFKDSDNDSDNYYDAQATRWGTLALADKVALDMEDDLFCRTLTDHTQDAPVIDRLYIAEVISSACTEYPDFFTAEFKIQLGAAIAYGYDLESEPSITQWLLEHGVGVDHHSVFTDTLAMLGYTPAATASADAEQSVDAATEVSS